MRKPPSEDNAKATSRILGGITGYTGHIPGLITSNIVGSSFRTSRRLSRAPCVPVPQTLGVRPGVSGYTGYINGSQGYQTCGLSYDVEVAHLKRIGADREDALRDVANWNRESDIMNASRLFESRPLRLDGNNLITVEECEAAKRVPVIRAPMRIPGQRSIQDDRVWSYQIKEPSYTGRVAGVSAYSRLAEPLRYASLYPGFRAGGC